MKQKLDINTLGKVRYNEDILMIRQKEISNPVIVMLLISSKGIPELQIMKEL